MIMTEQQREQLEKVSRPVMEFLSDNFHPHVKVIIDYSSAELLESSVRVVTEDYVMD